MVFIHHGLVCIIIFISILYNKETADNEFMLETINYMEGNKIMTKHQVDRVSVLKIFGYQHNCLCTNGIHMHKCVNYVCVCVCICTYLAYDSYHIYMI